MEHEEVTRQDMVLVDHGKSLSGLIYPFETLLRTKIVTLKILGNKAEVSAL